MSWNVTCEPLPATITSFDWWLCYTTLRYLLFLNRQQQTTSNHGNQLVEEKLEQRAHNHHGPARDFLPS